MLYNSFILSQFDYCSTIYLNINKEQMGEMQKIQNRAMRVLLNCERTTPKKHMLDKLKWLSVSQRIVLNSLMMIHKIKNNKGPEYLIEKVKFVGESHNRNTRSVNDFKLPIVKYEKSKKNLLYNGIKIFNQLPRDIKELTNIHVFKSKCNIYIRENMPIL